MSVVIALIVGLFLGFVLCFVSLIFLKKHNYAGVMKVVREENKVVFSLELFDDPMTLEHVNEVIFKVEPSDVSSDRK
jgi:hypothetical protein